MELWSWHLPQIQEQIPPSHKHTQARFGLVDSAPLYPASAQAVSALCWQSVHTLRYRFRANPSSALGLCPAASVKTGIPAAPPFFPLSVVTCVLVSSQPAGFPLPTPTGLISPCNFQGWLLFWPGQTPYRIQDFLSSSLVSFL